MGHRVSVTSTHAQLCCYRAKATTHNTYTNRWAWLCSSETLFTEVNLEQHVVQPADVCNPWYRRTGVFMSHKDLRVLKLFLHHCSCNYLFARFGQIRALLQRHTGKVVYFITGSHFSPLPAFTSLYTWLGNPSPLRSSMFPCLLILGQPRDLLSPTERGRKTNTPIPSLEQSSPGVRSWLLGLLPALGRERRMRCSWSSVDLPPPTKRNAGAQISPGETS